jgi:hypothetical protein
MSSWLIIYDKLTIHSSSPFHLKKFQEDRNGKKVTKLGFDPFFVAQNYLTSFQEPFIEMGSFWKENKNLGDHKSNF